MGQVVVQFGQHAGETSLWLVENCLGCAAYLVNSMKVEKLKSVMPHLIDTSLCLNDTSCHFLRSRRHWRWKRRRRIESCKRTLVLLLLLLYLSLFLLQLKVVQPCRVDRAFLQQSWWPSNQHPTLLCCLQGQISRPWQRWQILTWQMRLPGLKLQVSSLSQWAEKVHHGSVRCMVRLQVCQIPWVAEQEEQIVK